MITPKISTHFLVAIALTLLSLKSFAQYKQSKQLPENLLQSNCMLSLDVDESIFEELSERIAHDLKLMNINIVEKYNISKNPTIRAKNKDAWLKRVEELGIKNIISVSFMNFQTAVYDRYVVNKSKVVIAITSSDDFSSNDITLFMIKKNEYLKSLEELKKQIEKQFP